MSRIEPTNVRINHPIGWNSIVILAIVVAMLSIMAKIFTANHGVEEGPSVEPRSQRTDRTDYDRLYNDNPKMGVPTKVASQQINESKLKIKRAVENIITNSSEIKYYHPQELHVSLKTSESLATKSVEWIGDFGKVYNISYLTFESSLMGLAPGVMANVSFYFSDHKLTWGKPCGLSIGNGKSNFLLVNQRGRYVKIVLSVSDDIGVASNQRFSSKLTNFRYYWELK